MPEVLAAPEPASIDGRREFIDALKVLKIHAGDPSWRELGRRTRLPHTTLASLLDLRRRGLPGLQAVTALLRGLGLSQPEVEPWMMAWRRIQAASAVATPPIQGWTKRHDLPRDVSMFTGRGAEIERVLSAATSTAAPTIWAIGGMPGVGKTALAVHLGHALKLRCPDASLFLDLRGHGDAQPAVEPGQALRHLLTAVGVAARAIPRDLNARAALWRATLQTRRVLLVLDDAVDCAQVTPLLPGSPGCHVLVTSRHRLAGLTDAMPLNLDVLGPYESESLFTAMVGLVGRRQPVVSAIVRRCGFLPLAVRSAAKRLLDHPTWTVADLLGRLGCPGRDEEAVASAFRRSFDRLTPAQLRLLQRLAELRVTDVNAHSAAELLDGAVKDAARLLEELAHHHLLRELAPGQYRAHLLLREYAAATQTGSPQSAAGVVRRA